VGNHFAKRVACSRTWETALHLALRVRAPATRLRGPAKPSSRTRETALQACNAVSHAREHAKRNNNAVSHAREVALQTCNAVSHAREVALQTCNAVSHAREPALQTYNAVSHAREPALQTYNAVSHAREPPVHLAVRVRARGKPHCILAVRVRACAIPPNKQQGLLACRQNGAKRVFSNINKKKLHFDCLHTDRVVVFNDKNGGFYPKNGKQKQDAGAPPPVCSRGEGGWRFRGGHHVK
jgi:hypothetical protein